MAHIEHVFPRSTSDAPSCRFAWARTGERSLIAKKSARSVSVAYARAPIARMIVHGETEEWWGKR